MGTLAPRTGGASLASGASRVPLWANTQCTEHAATPSRHYAASRHPGDLVLERPPPRLVLGGSLGGDAADEEETEHAVALALVSRAIVSKAVLAKHCN